MLRLLDGATQLKDATTRPGADCGANAGGAKPSYREERFIGELETIIK
jgi:hypothetical protein